MPRYALLLVAVALSVVACTPDGGGTTTTAAGPVITTPSSSTTTTGPPDGFGGHITIGLEAPVTSLNPFASDFFGGSASAGNAVWATVYKVDPLTWQKIPDTVTSLPTQGDGGIVDNGDGTITVQYQVVPRATWSDGVPITGADLAFTAEAMRDLAMAGNPHVDPIMANVVATNSVEQVAWVTLQDATLAFEDALWIILPSHVLADVNIATSSGVTWPAGGPFMVHNGDPASMTRNPNYWKTDGAGRQLPYADSLSFVATGVDATASLENGDVDVIEIFDTDMFESAVAVSGVAVQTASTPFVEQITFNLGPGAAATNPESHNDSAAFRAAVAHAIDRTTILESAGVLWDPTTPGVLIPKGSSAWNRYGYDPAESRNLVSSLQAPVQPVSVLSTTVDGRERPVIAAALESAFAPIGVGYDSALFDSVQFYGDTLPSGTFDLGMWAWENDGGYADTIAMLKRFDPAHSQEYSGWGLGDPPSEASIRYSELVDLAQTTVDVSEFAAIVEEAEEILASELPLIPLFHRASYLATRTEAVTGVIHNGMPSSFTWNVGMWQVPGE